MVFDDAELDVRRHFCAKFGQFFLDAFGHLHGICSGLLKNIDFDAWFAVISSADTQLGMRILDLGDILDIDQLSFGAAAYSHLAYFLEAFVLSHSACDKLAAFHGHSAGKGLFIV